jgi:hypothetical protein
VRQKSFNRVFDPLGSFESRCRHGTGRPEGCQRSGIENVDRTAVLTVQQWGSPTRSNDIPRVVSSPARRLATPGQLTAAGRVTESARTEAWPRVSQIWLCRGLAAFEAVGRSEAKSHLETLVSGAAHCRSSITDRTTAHLPTAVRPWFGDMAW